MSDPYYRCPCGLFFWTSPASSEKHLNANIHKRYAEEHPEIDFDDSFAWAEFIPLEKRCKKFKSTHEYYRCPCGFVLKSSILRTHKQTKAHINYATQHADQKFNLFDIDTWAIACTEAEYGRKARAQQSAIFASKQ